MTPVWLAAVSGLVGGFVGGRAALFIRETIRRHRARGCQHELETVGDGVTACSVCNPRLIAR